MSGGKRTATTKARLVQYEAKDISQDMSFLEMLDVVNEGLVKQGRGPDLL